MQIPLDKKSTYWKYDSKSIENMITSLFKKYLKENHITYQIIISTNHFFFLLFKSFLLLSYIKLQY